MKKFKILPFLLLLLSLSTSVAAQKKTQKTYIPWSNGKLVVSEEGRYLKHEMVLLSSGWGKQDGCSQSV